MLGRSGILLGVTSRYQHLSLTSTHHIRHLFLPGFPHQILHQVIPSASCLVSLFLLLTPPQGLSVSLLPRSRKISPHDSYLELRQPLAMDASARSKLPAIRKEDWRKLGYARSQTNDADEGLTNEIDPIFRYTHPSRDVPIWINVTEEQYNELLVDILPMLRLATRMIRSAPSLNADYDLYYSPRVHPEKRVNYEDQSVLQIHRVETTKEYWPQRMALATAALDRLAGVVSFQILAKSQHPALENTMGVTSIRLRVHPNGVNIQDDTNITKGIGSVITINQRLIAELQRLRKNKALDNTLKINSLTFEGAVFLCHELFHTKYNATDPAVLLDAIVNRSLQSYAAVRRLPMDLEIIGTNEPLWEDDSDAELGYVWEKYMFGGVHIQFEGDVDRCLFFSKWPSYWVGVNFRRRRGWRGKMTRYVVPMHFILNLLRQKFWDEMIEGDLTALHIKKWIGFRKNCDISEFVDPEWKTDDSSESEYPLRKSSDPRVCREKDGEILPDPSASRANETRTERLEREKAAATEVTSA